MMASLTADDHPDAADGALPVPLGSGRLHTLRLPGIEQRPAYALAWALTAWRARRPAVQVRPGGGFSADVTLSDTLRRRWHEFYRTDASRGIPYLFAQGTATLLHRRLLAGLGLDLGQVQHLRQVTHHVRGAEPQSRVPRQRLSCRLQRLGHLDGGLLLVVTDTLLTSADGHALALVEDSFVATGVDVGQWPGLPRDSDGVADVGQVRRRAPKLPRLDANLGEWVIGHDWGRRYAALSGEMHWQHLGHLTARLLGQRHTTLQASALRNLVVRQLADVGLLPERFDITFCRPVQLGDRISVVQRDDRFEVIAGDGRLVAFGHC